MRKLEFLLADALEKGCDTVITFGAFDSNHARATSLAARELGLEPYVFIIDFQNTVKVYIQYLRNLTFKLYTVHDCRVHQILIELKTIVVIKDMFLLV